MGSGEVRLLRSPPGDDFALSERLPSLIICSGILDADRGVNSSLSARLLTGAGVASLCAGMKNDSCAFGDPGRDMLVAVLYTSDRSGISMCPTFGDDAWRFHVGRAVLSRLLLCVTLATSVDILWT